MQEFSNDDTEPSDCMNTVIYLRIQNISMLMEYIIVGTAFWVEGEVKIFGAKK
jgi:hypothetical protein